MSTPIPPPLRAAAGLAALTIDTARKVPQQLVGLPVLAVSTALQASLKAQQTYAALIARGDEVLGQLRRGEDAPWARFDEDEPTGVRPRSAFDAAPEPAETVVAETGVAETGVAEGGVAEGGVAEGGVAEGGVAEAADGVADALASEDLSGALTAEAEELADSLAAEDLSEALTAEAAEEAVLVEEVERDLDPDRDADVVALSEARAAQAQADAENVLGETEEDEVAAADAALADLGVPTDDLGIEPTDADRPNGRPEGSGTEPGTDMPADGMALAADAAAAGAALSADVAVGGPGGPPLAGYDHLSIPQLRGRLRGLSEEQVEALLGYERSTLARPPYLTMLENRLTVLRSR